MKRRQHTSQLPESNRRGSTLIIVIALLGLLAFTGMVFFTFASQERSASESFSEAAKGTSPGAAEDVFEWMLEQVIVGPSSRLKGSVLYSKSRRHSLLSNMVGSDIHPYTGQGINVIFQDDPATASPALVARVDQDNDGDANDEDGGPGEPDTQGLLNFVDSPAANNGAEDRAAPSPDVDYTYPDLNNLFLAYKGWALRENPSGTFTQVPVIIPSFFRPQYMKTTSTNGRLLVGNPDVPTDANWAQAFDGINRNTAVFGQRSFRPHPLHIAGFAANGTTPVFRFLTTLDAATAGLSRGFPFYPEDKTTATGNDPAVRGELGIWTGSAQNVYELDVDNDGDGINEGIWLDLHYPLQQTNELAPRNYVVLHSVTIYDLNSLIDVNVHGNLAGLERGPTINTLTNMPPQPGSLEANRVSRSNLGLGPNEISPLWALRRDIASSSIPPSTNRSEYQTKLTAHAASRQFLGNVGDIPDNDLEQANVELLWLLTGRLDFKTDGSIQDLHSGRWGEDEWVFNALHTIGGDSGNFVAADLPRPGRSGDSYQVVSSGPRYGGSYTSNGRSGFDDNQDRFDGEKNLDTGQVLPFGHPMDYAGTGRFTSATATNYDIGTRRFTTSGDATVANLYQQATPVGPARWVRYDGYSMVRDVVDANRYIFGINQASDNGTGDDLITNPFFDALFDDPMETVFDIDYARRPFDDIFGPQDVFELQLDTSLISSSTTTISSRLSSLAPFAFDRSSDPGFATDAVRDRFTSYGNTPRFGALRFPDYGDDGFPGLQGVDDDGNGFVDDPSDAKDNADNTEHAARWWEFTADSDGADRNGDGFGDGDGKLEFPPAFGLAGSKITPYLQRSPFAATQDNDPFRPQMRRLLTVELGETRQLLGQLPMSINHLLDVNRSEQTPAEGTKEFLQFMQRSGMRFRALTDHPDAVNDTNVPQETTVPTLASITSGVLPPFPPQTIADREFWARRDRQQMARDIYVLLYTIGGGRIDDSALSQSIMDYTGSNADRTGPGSGTLYSEDQLRRMAQFAVNVVDTLDTDAVMTRFEYDKNLGDGWNLDDDPWTDTDTASTATVTVPAPGVTKNGMYPEDAGDRGVVYGVEAQQLTLSEVLAVRSQSFDSQALPDDPLTVHQNTGDPTLFLHVELQNMLPTSVDLASTETNNADPNHAIWRLGRVDRAGTAGDAQAAPTENVALMEGNGPVAGGERFTISMAGKDGSPGATNPTGWGTSDLYADIDDSTPGDAFTLISPDLSTTAIPLGTPNPECDLDLWYDLEAAGPQLAIVTDDTSKRGGAFLQGIQNYEGNTDFHITNVVDPGFELVLQRRMNPNLPKLSLAENPWVSVDRSIVEFRDLYEFVGTGPAVAELRLDGLASVERAEAIDASTSGPHSKAGDSDPQNYDENGDGTADEYYRRNTIGSALNSRTSVAFNLFQSHFDRDFASMGELLHLPVVGPELLTARFGKIGESPYQQIGVGATDDSDIVGAAAMILWPDLDPTIASDSEATSEFDNRWYRFFQFAEVPSRVHRVLGNYLTQNRLPGKMNINMFRHMEVYAGLIDDPTLADVADSDRLNEPFLRGNVVDAVGRDRWQEYLEERDGASVTGYEPGGGAPGPRQYTIPGTPSARPFRSMGFSSTDVNDNGLDHTILRRLANDRNNGIPESNRNWLEVGADVAFHQTSAATVNRHQLLSKVLGNTTTVSNTFIVYSSAAYFEAVQTPNGLIQVGGRIDLDNPTDNGDSTLDTGEDHTSGWLKQSAFIIDRTEFLNAHDPGTGGFDWKRLIKARLDIK